MPTWSRPSGGGDTDDVDGYVDLVCGRMLAACAPHSRWIDVFVEDGAFGADAARTILGAGRAAGLGLRVHANQLGPGPGVQVACELGAASADHCTHLTDDDVGALADSDTVATLLPGAEFSTRSSPTPTPAACWTPASPSRWRPTATPAPHSRPRCR